MSEGNPAGGPIEEAHPEIVFERFDLKSNRGLRQKEMFGRLAKIQMFGHGAKDLQTKILQLGHGEIMRENCSEMGASGCVEYNYTHCGTNLRYEAGAV